MLIYGKTYLNWYNKIIVANLNPVIQGNEYQLRADYEGEFFLVTSDGRKVFQILKTLGFRWNGIKGNSMWYTNLHDLMDKPEAVSTLSSLDINIDSLIEAMPANGIGPAPTPIPIPQRQKAIPESTSNLPEKSLLYILAEAINIDGVSQGEPIATRSDNGKILYITESGEEGVIPDRSKMKYVKDLSDKMIMGRSLKELFQKYRELNPNYNIEKIETVENDPMEEDTDVMPIKEGSLRIPEDMISPYQKDIEKGFLDSDKNIVINALAGTGKTSVLKHLASFKPENERWLYLVFNKKNQLEAKEEFPDGVDVYTSHSFLGRVLQFNGENLPKTDLWSESEGDFSKKDKKRKRFGRTKSSYFIDELMKDDISFPRSKPTQANPNGKPNYDAKMVINKIVSLSKASAVNPMDANATEQIDKVIREFYIDTRLPDKYGDPGPDYQPQLVEKSLIILRACLPSDSDTQEQALFPRESLELRDHDDTLWFSALRRESLNWPVQNYDVILVDEVQDFNECQRMMLEVLSTHAKIIAVGDPNQSIYMFRGAGQNAFDKTQKTLVGTNRGAGGLPFAG